MPSGTVVHLSTEAKAFMYACSKSIKEAECATFDVWDSEMHLSIYGFGIDSRPQEPVLLGRPSSAPPPDSRFTVLGQSLPFRT